MYKNKKKIDFYLNKNISLMINGVFRNRSN